jgi:uncharacterized coiled-coil DUF342 family protein
VATQLQLIKYIISYIVSKLNAENTGYVKIVNKSFENLDRASKKQNFMHEDIKSRQIAFREYRVPFGTESPIFPTGI